MLRIDKFLDSRVKKSRLVCREEPLDAIRSIEPSNRASVAEESSVGINGEKRKNGINTVETGLVNNRNGREEKRRGIFSRSRGRNDRVAD